MHWQAHKMRYITKYFIPPSKSRLAGSTTNYVVLRPKNVSQMWLLMSDFTLIFDWNFTRKMVLCVLLPKSLPVCEKCNSLAVISSKQYKPSPRDDTHRLLRPKITVAKVKFKLLFCQFNSIPPNLIYLLLCF